MIEIKEKKKLHMKYLYQESEMEQIIDKLPVHPNRIYKKVDRLDMKNMIVLHCTGARANPFKTAKYHISPESHLMKGGAPAIAYHVMIDWKGNPYQCLPWNTISYHASGYNTRSVGVAICYNPLERDNTGIIQIPPNKSQLKTLSSVLEDVCLETKIEPCSIRPHNGLWGTGWVWQWFDKGSVRKRRRVPLKVCPGKMIDMYMLVKEVSMKIQLRLYQLGYYDNEIDGIWGKYSKRGFKKFKSNYGEQNG